MTNDKTREAFEKWYFSQYPYGETKAVHSAHKSGAYEGWQASKAESDALIRQLRGMIKEAVDCFCCPKAKQALSVIKEYLGEK